VPVAIVHENILAWLLLNNICNVLLIREKVIGSYYAKMSRNLKRFFCIKDCHFRAEIDFAFKKLLEGTA